MTAPQSAASAPEPTLAAPVIDLRERQRPARPQRAPYVEATMPSPRDARRPSRGATVGVAVAVTIVVGFYVALPIALLARAVVPQTVFLAPAVLVTATVLVIRRVLRATVTEPVIDLTDAGA